MRPCSSRSSCSEWSDPDRRASPVGGPHGPRTKAGPRPEVSDHADAIVVVATERPPPDAPSPDDPGRALGLAVRHGQALPPGRVAPRRLDRDPADAAAPGRADPAARRTWPGQVLARRPDCLADPVGL